MKKWIVVLLLLLALGGYFIISRKDASKAMVVETTPITRGKIIKTVSATGSLQAVNTVNVGTQVSGTVKAIYADFNSITRKGALIAEIDPALLQANLETAKADVLSAQADLAKAEATVKNTRKNRDRKKELYSRDLIAESELDAAQTEYDTALAQLKAAKASLAQSQANLRHKEVSLGYTRITSPINGVVIDRTVEVGQTVNASQSAPTLFTIAKSAEIRRELGLEDDVRIEHHITETWKSIVRQPYDRRDELLELAKTIPNISAKHEGGNPEDEQQLYHQSDILDYFRDKKEIVGTGDWEALTRNYLLKHKAVNTTAEALTKAGLSFIAAGVHRL
jgi:multidrug efflux pump subunit AcrA (membrane-fusion protein)